MPLNWKRIGLLTGFLLAVVLLGYGLYFVFLKPIVPEPPPEAPPDDQVPGELPAAGTNVSIPTVGNVNGALPPGVGREPSSISPPEDVPAGTQSPATVATGGLTQTQSVSTGRAAEVRLSADGNTAVYYDPENSKFYRVSPTGQIAALSDKLFFEVEKVTWAPNTEQAILEYPDESNTLYNFTTGRQVTLPQHWKDFSFSPNGQQLTFKSIGRDPDNRWLAIANADGSKAISIEALGEKDSSVYPLWSPNNQIIAMFTEDVDFNRQELFFVGKNNENFKSIVLNGRGLQAKWSPSGNELLYSVYSSATDYKPTLWIAQASGQNIGDGRRDLRLQTWADKCTFANASTVYCAVPQSLREGAGIFTQELDSGPNDIYKIDLQTGFRSKVATPQGNHNISTLFVTENGGTLYFQSNTNGRLYGIRLR